MAELIATQANLPIAVRTAIAPDKLLLESFHGVEGISRLFTFELDMLSADSDIPAEKVLGTGMSLRLTLPDETERHIHGIVSRFTLSDVEREYARFHAELVPWPALLKHSFQSRIFQEKTVLEIVEEVFESLGFSDYDIACTRPYAARTYCVQYRETDWNFVSRLLEEEGIWYYFKHMEDAHLLVLGDDNESFPDVRGGTCLFAPHGVHGESDVVDRLVQQHAIHSGVVSLQAYDYRQPSLSLGVRLEGESEVGGLSSLEHYDYLGDYAPGTESTRPEGDRQARLRLEEKEARYHTAEGRSDVRALQSGSVFELDGHPVGDHNRLYLLRTVRHFARNGALFSGQVGGFEYRNEFQCLPDDIPFRPPRRTPAPVVHGHQTAVVVGRQGEEVWTDEHGRVKVQFHWDRHGENDENSSCWLRVATMWAGRSYGSVWIPRIGHEVVVAFLEGDPDRPIIVGGVYNDENRAPYPLPDDQVKGGIKTRSSKGGDGHNEIAFDDKKGEELVTVHAEKNLGERVGNNRTRNVGANETVTVGHDQTITVKNDQTLTVENDQIVVVENNRDLTVVCDDASKIEGSRTISIDGDDSLEVLGSCTVHSDGDLALDSAVNVSVASGADTAVDAGGNLAAQAGINVDVSAGASMNLAAPMIKVKADGAVEIAVGGSSIKLTPAGIEIAAPMITISGSAMVDIKGGLVKVNS